LSSQSTLTYSLPSINPEPNAKTGVRLDGQPPVTPVILRMPVGRRGTQRESKDCLRCAAWQSSSTAAPLGAADLVRSWLIGVSGGDRGDQARLRVVVQKLALGKPIKVGTACLEGGWWRGF
jgi:hypothetical protein